MLRCSALPLLFSTLTIPASAQNWDVGSLLAERISAKTGGKLKVSFDSRGRYELRHGQGFGSDPDADTGLFRTRLGLSFTPVSWLKLSAAATDSRAPWFGSGAPPNLRDQVDLHEGYIELFPDRKTGFGLTAGRMALSYGESRLIGTSQWNNASRSFDHARGYYRTLRARLELLFITPIRLRTGEFNSSVFGDHIWGAYNSFPDLFRQSLVDVYFLRHSQNRPGGFSRGSSTDGTDRLAVNTIGGRWTGPLNSRMKFSLEGALQTGKVGPARHRAAAWFSALTRTWTLGARRLDISAEYKYASGTADPGDPSRSSTFDQLYPSNHDKFGHQDLFGWRNIHSARSLATIGLNRYVSLSLMYNSVWLASARDALYNGVGRAIVHSASGTAGRHVGQEADVFITFKYNHFTLGAGYGYFFNGHFIRNTTPGANPVYAYVFHQYSF